MDAFIKPYQMNYVRKLLNQLLSAVYFAGDYRVYAATKENVVVKIHEAFGALTPEQENLFDNVENLRGQDELNAFMKSLEPFVIPFPSVTPQQLRKLFPKVKKLTLPDLDTIDYSTLTYLGWRDSSSHAIYLVYESEGRIHGLHCRYSDGSANVSCICSLCGQWQSAQEVGLVVTKSKVNENKSYGIHMCLNSALCNSYITKEDELSKFLHRLMG